MKQKKRDQHYVFQAYLNKWTGENKKLWCLRDKEIFEVKPKNIAFEKDFYRISSLSDKEIEFLKLFFRKTGDGFKKEMDHFIELYTTFDENERFFNFVRTLLPAECPEADSAMDDIDSMLDIARNNILEDTYAEFEGEAVVWLNSLCEENLDFFYNPTDNQKERFISFICIQYSKTKRMKDSIISVLKEAEEYFVNESFPKGSIRANNLWLPMLWLLSAQFADALLQAQLTLLINSTEIPFVTSDQPVINTKADYADLSQQPTELVFYYPISPRIAILLNNNSEETRKVLSCELKVQEYNDLIAKASYKMLFASKSTALEGYQNQS